MKPNLLSIRAAVDRAQSEGIPVSETALRRWAKSGEIRVVHSGTKALIYFPTLVEFVTGVPYANQSPAERSA